MPVLNSKQENEGCVRPARIAACVYKYNVCTAFVKKKKMKGHQERASGHFAPTQPHYLGRCAQNYKADGYENIPASAAHGVGNG